MLLYKRAFLFCIVTLAGITILHSQSVHLLGNFNKPYGNSGSTNFSSCWGWVSPTGKEYALIGTCEGTSIIDINSDTLKEVAFIPGPQASYCLREMKTYKQYAYITTEAGAGVQIVDLSGLPDTAILVKNFIYYDSTTSPPRHTTYSHTVTIGGDLLILNGCRGWTPNSGAVVFSLKNDPTTPELIFDITTNYFHDTYMRHDTMYASAIYNNEGLYIIDMTDLEFPYIISNIRYNGAGTHNSWVSMDGKYVFTADEIGSTTHNMKVWDISNLPSYSFVTGWAGDPSSIVHNVHGRGNYVYVAHYTGGMFVADVHDPTSPFAAGAFQSYSGQHGGYAGCWEVYPYFFSGKWIGSDMQTGLYVFTFDSLQPRQRPHLLNPPDNMFGTFNLDFEWTSAANQNNDPHWYELHIKGENVDTFFTSTDTTFHVQWDNYLHTGNYDWYVLVKDEYTGVSSLDTFHFNLIVEGVENSNSFPQKISLHQNYPNPFNPLTKIEFELHSFERVTLTIFDEAGKEIRTLLNDVFLSPGKQEVAFRADDLPSGVYYYRLIAGNESLIKQMILVK